jgi:hypothetical protein
MTRDQLEGLPHQRLAAGEWEVEMDGKKVNLAEVARLTVRDLVVKPFTVKLVDGREAVIVPDAKKIGRYMVTGEYFERDVRDHLLGPYLEDPAGALVLTDIPVPGGHVPNAWGANHVHVSSGEPLREFAKVEIRGKPGPQAPELERMRRVNKHLEAGMRLAEGMPRGAFEARFGKGTKGPVHSHPYFGPSEPLWEYPFGSSKLYVYFDDEMSKVRHVSTHTQKPLPLEPSGDCGRMARAAADDERALLLAFLTKMSQSASPAERTALRTLVKETAADLKWTDQERKRLLGN